MTMHILRVIVSNNLPQLHRDIKQETFPFLTHISDFFPMLCRICTGSCGLNIPSVRTLWTICISSHGTEIAREKGVVSEHLGVLSEEHRGKEIGFENTNTLQ